MFERIVLATDFGESSRKASDVALRLAKTSRATIFLVHAYEIPITSLGYAPGAGIPAPGVDVEAVLGPIETAARDELRAEATRLGGASVEPILRSGAPWEEVLTVAKEKNADLIVVGSHGRRGLSRTLLGSVAEKIARLAEIPVLLVRETHEAGEKHETGTRRETK
ncbi:universal stress protein [Pendulispora albinea]|uniref:Universal stress protein n=1 Tax=Pendulispora albinea TaxID=2741071 RepID=A0ABZ2LU99_9BACT